MRTMDEGAGIKPRAGSTPIFCFVTDAWFPVGQYVEHRTRRGVRVLAPVLNETEINRLLTHGHYHRDSVSGHSGSEEHYEQF